MKIIGGILIIGALVAGSILLADSVPSYFKNGDNIARAEERAEQAIVKGDARTAEDELDTIVFLKEIRQRRLIETMIASGGMVLLIGIGFMMMRKAGRKTKQRDPIAVARAA